MERRIAVTLRSARHLVHPLPGVIVPSETLARWQLRPRVPVGLRVGDRVRTVWLVEASETHLRLFTKLSAGADGDGETNPDDARPVVDEVFVDWRSAALLGLGESHGVPAELTYAGVELAAQPQRIDDRLATAQVVLARDVLDGLGADDGFVLLSSRTRRMAVRARPEGPGVPSQAADRVRLSFHARLLLGLEKGEEGERPLVTVSALPPVDLGSAAPPIWRRAFDGIAAGFAVLGTLALRAPRVALAVTESATSDDDEAIVRCSQSTMNVIGIEPGDTLIVSWAGRSALARAFLSEAEGRIDIGQTEVVSWFPQDRSAPLPTESTVTVPAAVRNGLGVPRDGVVTVRRSLGGLVRKRMIGLAIPLVGVAISVAQLGLNLWLGLTIFVASGILTLAGDRIVRPRVRVRKDA